MKTDRQPKLCRIIRIRNNCATFLPPATCKNTRKVRLRFGAETSPVTRQAERVKRGSIALTIIVAMQDLRVPADQKERKKKIVLFSDDLSTRPSRCTKSWWYWSNKKWWSFFKNAVKIASNLGRETIDPCECYTERDLRLSFPDRKSSRFHRTHSFRETVEILSQSIVSLA